MVALLWLQLAGCEQSPRQIQIQVGRINATAELADTVERRQKGLMHRQSLARDTGLLMVFPNKERVVSLWMLNTPLPLDVGFFDREGRLFQIEQMAPDGGKAIYKSIKPAAYALEMNQGWFARHAIALGARLKGDDVPMLNR